MGMGISHRFPNGMGMTLSMWNSHMLESMGICGDSSGFQCEILFI